MPSRSLLEKTEQQQRIGVYAPKLMMQLLIASLWLVIIARSGHHRVSHRVTASTATPLPVAPPPTINRSKGCSRVEVRSFASCCARVGTLSKSSIVSAPLVGSLPNRSDACDLVESRYAPPLAPATMAPARNLGNNMLFVWLKLAADAPHSWAIW